MPEPPGHDVPIQYSFARRSFKITLSSFHMIKKQLLFNLNFGSVVDGWTDRHKGMHRSPPCSYTKWLKKFETGLTTKNQAIMVLTGGHTTTCYQPCSREIIYFCPSRFVEAAQVAIFGMSVWACDTYTVYASRSGQY